MAAAYHMGFGKVTAAVDFSGQPYVYSYDPFGHLTEDRQAG